MYGKTEVSDDNQVYGPQLTIFVNKKILSDGLGETKKQYCLVSLNWLNK